MSSLEGFLIILHVYLIGFMHLIVELLLGPPKLANNWKWSHSEAPVAIVTGGTTGIGRKTVEILLEKGFQVIVLAKNFEKSDRDRWELRTVDLASIAQVKSVANKLLQELNILHLLVNNAGVMLHPFQLTADGFETHFAVNYLAHAILIDRLMPLLKRARNKHNFGRIINISSSTLFAGKLRLDKGLFHSMRNGKSQLHPQFGTEYENGYSAYSDSKLAFSIYTKILADISLNPKLITFHGFPSISPVEILSLHPGVVPGNLYRFSEFPVRQLLCYFPLRNLLRTSENAATDVINLCLRDDVSSGAYYEYGYTVPICTGTDEDEYKLFVATDDVIRNL